MEFARVQLRERERDVILSRQQKAQIASRPRVIPQSVPAPYGGWNTRDALDEMQTTDAILLDNWFVDTQGVKLRKGFLPFATGAGSTPVKTLAEFYAGSTRKLLAASSGSIYDISGGGSTTFSIGSGFHSDAWQTTNFLGRLFFCNGLDPVQVFDGSVLSAANFTGVNTSTLIGCAIYQQFLIFWQANSTGFWYAQLNSISGALAFYDLSALTPHGGNLIAVTTTTHDGGNGVFDFVTFVMSSGVCIHFLGNDPSLIADWQLIGIYSISSPVSPRAVCQYGAESFLTTADDHVPLQQQLVALKLGQLPPRSKVSSAVQAAVAANPNGFGWQALYYPAGRRLIFNIPNTDGSFSQHICNTALPAQPWSRFIGMNAYCWGLFNGNLYFGSSNGVVYQADFGNSDNGAPIMGIAQQAWNTFAQPIRKKISVCRPMIQPAGSTPYTFTLGFDYATLNLPVLGVSQASGTAWNVSPWNSSSWSAAQSVDSRWKLGGGSGQSIGWALQISSLLPTIWLRTDFRYEPGSGL